MSLQQSAKKDLLCYLLLAVFLIIAYLPVSSFLFALKNDALTDNFPNKYFFSASLQAGYLPLWNPYINFGLPLYADPGFAFWEPITWIFGYIGYNIYTLTIEVLFYIWLAGVFMYELGKYFRHSFLVCFLMAAMYMCCGFFIGNLQHINFITCAAFLPIGVKTFLQLQEKFSYRRLLYCALSLYFLTTGGHPAIPFATIYFLTAIFLCLFFFRDKGQNKKVFYSQLLKSNLLLIVCFVVLATPLLYSYLEVMPYISRSGPVNQNNNAYAGFSITSYLSFLFPFATTAKSDIFNNSSLMRNGYFSFIGFAFFLVSLFSLKNKYQIIFLISGMMMLVLSLGGAAKIVIYPYLPFLKYIRINGEYRIFSILSFIIIASFPLNKSFESNTTGIADKIFLIFMSIGVIVILWVMLHPSQALVFSKSQHEGNNMRNEIKWWLDNLKMYDRLLISAIVLLVFLLLYFLLKKNLPSRVLLAGIIIADLLIFAWLHLPVTGVQKRSVAAMENYFSEVRPGIPIPSLIPIKNNTWAGGSLSKIIGCWPYYSKQPGTPAYCDYPTLLSSTKDYFLSSLPMSVNRQPFIFFKADSGSSSSLVIRKFSPGSISIQTNTENPDTLILLQNFYPNWKVLVNNQPASIHKEFISFIGVPLQHGNNHIYFYFKNNMLLVYVFVSVSSLLIVISLALYEAKAFFEKRKRNS